MKAGRDLGHRSHKTWRWCRYCFDPWREWEPQSFGVIHNKIHLWGYLLSEICEDRFMKESIFPPVLQKGEVICPPQANHLFPRSCHLAVVLNGQIIFYLLSWESCAWKMGAWHRTIVFRKWGTVGTKSVRRDNALVDYSLTITI